MKAMAYSGSSTNTEVGIEQQGIFQLARMQEVMVGDVLLKHDVSSELQQSNCT